MLGRLKSYSSIDRYLHPLAAIQVVLLITTIFYSFVLVKETASLHIGHYKFEPIVFPSIQGGSGPEENLTRLEIEKKKLKKILNYFSNDYITAILNYFWLVSPESIVDFRVQGAEVLLVLDEHEKLLRETVVHTRPFEVEEQLILEEINKLVLQLIDMQSPSHQIVAMQRKGFLLMKLINHGLIAQDTGLSEELILEIETDLTEFQIILNAFKSGNKVLKIDRLRDQGIQKSLSIIENGFESIKQSKLKTIRKKTISFEPAGAQKEKLDAPEMLFLASKLLDSELSNTFSKLTTSVNVLAILILEMLISVTFIIMIITRGGSNDLNAGGKFEVSEPVFEETVDTVRLKELSSNITDEAEVIFDRLEHMLRTQLNDLYGISDFNEQLKRFHAYLAILVGVFDFFRLESYMTQVKHIAQALEESEKNKSLDSEKLSELVMDLQKILGSVSFKRDIASLG